MKDTLPGAFGRAARVCAVATLLLILAAPVWAQPLTHNVGSNLGTWSVGEVSYSLDGSGGSGPYTWTLVSGTLPPGLAIRTDLPPWMSWADAALWGIATAPGDYAFTLRVDDGTTTADVATTMRITAFAVTNLWQVPPAFTGVAYSHQFHTVNAAGTVSWTDTSSPPLPTGMALSASGLLTVDGTVPAGWYQVNFSITDGTDTLWLGTSLEVRDLRITTGVLPSVTPGEAYSAVVEADGGTLPYSFSTGAWLPPGLSMNAAGAITGTTTSGPGRWEVWVTVTDSGAPAQTRSKAVVIVVVAVPPALPSIHPHGGRFHDCTVGVPCTLGIWIQGTPPVAWGATGLPPGLAIGPASDMSWVKPGDGEIVGVPRDAGDFQVTITATDAAGGSVTNTFALRVSTLAAPNYGHSGTLGLPLSMPLRIIGGTPPYSVVHAEGRLPQGVAFNPATLEMSGTPEETGSFNPVFDVTDDAGQTLRFSVPFGVSSSGPGIQHHGHLGSYSAGSFLSQQLFACCAPGYAWSVIGGAMPPELTLSPGGLLSAASLDTPGQYSFLVQVADSTDPSSVTALLFSINVTSLSSDFPNELPAGNVGTAYSAALTLNGATGAVTWQLEPFYFLPPGLGPVEAGGAWSLAGTPAATGRFEFRLRATDSTGQTLTRDVSVSIYPAGVTPPVAIVNGPDLGTWWIGEVGSGLSATGGNGSYTWSLVSGTLPTGVALRTAPYLPSWFHASQTAGLIGIATVPGTYTFRLRVESGGASFERDFTWRITGFTFDDHHELPDAFVGHAYSYQLSTSGHVGAVTWAPNGPLPVGFSLSADGVLSSTGAGLVPGFYGINVAATDTIETVSRTFNVGVFAIRFTTPGELPNATQGQVYSTTIVATGGDGTLTYTLDCCLPWGLTLAPDGTLWGTVNTGPGRYSFNVTATDGNLTSYTRRMVVTVVGDPLTLPSISSRFSGNDCTFGVACWQTLSVGSGGTAPFTWSAVGLPDGLSIQAAGGTSPRWMTPGDGEVRGLPRQLGTFAVTVTVTDFSGASATNTFPLRVSALTAHEFFPAGDRDVPYVHPPIRIIGGEPGYTATIVAGRLPAGMSFDAATQVLSGTPLENGGFNVTFDVVDSDSPANRLRFGRHLQIGAGTSTISINDSDLGTAFVSTSPDPPTSYFRTLWACCVPGTFTWTLESGALPVGLTLDPGGSISGTIDQANLSGPYTFRVRAAHSTNLANYGIRDLTLTLTRVRVDGNWTLPDGNVGTPYSYAFTASGGTGIQTWSLAADTVLPPGLTFSSAGVLDGTPEHTGLFFFTVNVSDSGGNVASFHVNVSIYPVGQYRPLAIVFGDFTGAQRGVFSAWLNAFNVSGGVGPYTFSLTPDAELPAGAPQIPGMRVLSGPPFPWGSPPSGALAAYAGVLAEPGVYTPSIRVTDSLGTTADRVFTVHVTPLAILSQWSLPRATRGEPYSFAMEATGGGNYLWSANNLPAGLSIDPVTGVISGTPESGASTTFPSMSVMDQATGDSVSGGFTLPVNAFAITTSSALPPATGGVPYSVTLAGAGCAGTCTWSFQGGGLPGGLSLNSTTGVISGLPLTGSAGFVSSFTAVLTGSNGSASRRFSLIVVGPTFPVLRIGTTSIGDQTVGNQVSVQINAFGGAPPYAWTIDAGALPPGVSLVTSGEDQSSEFAAGLAYLAGRALVAGEHTFTLRVTDQNGDWATQAFTWNISRLSLQTTNLPAPGGPPLDFGQPYSQQLLVLGGTNDYPSWINLAPMPPSLSLDAATGVVGGTPTNTSGVPSVPIQVTDSAGNTITQNVNFNITTGAPQLFFPGADRGTVQVGALATIYVNPGGATGPVTVTALSALPPGFQLLGPGFVGGPTSEYQVLGYPQEAGTFTFTLRADEPSTGAFAVRTFTVRVVPFLVPFNPTLPDTFVGNGSYSQQLLVGGVNGTWTLAPGSRLPAGLTLSSTGLLSGTPAQVGSFGFAVDISDASGSIVRRTYTLNVSAIALNDDGVLPGAVVGTPYFHQFSGAGAGVFWTASGLPAGISLDASTGVLSGTPTARTTLSFNVTANDGVRAITRRFTLFVRDPIPAVLDVPATSAALGQVTLGQSLLLTLRVNSGMPPYTWSVAPGSSLPPGLSLVTAAVQTNLNPDATALGGIPTAAGDYAFDLLVTDAAGTVARRTYTLRVVPVSVLGGNPPTAIAGAPYTAVFKGFGGTGPYTFSALPADLAGVRAAAAGTPPLPPGLTLAPDGTLSGTPTSTGSYTFRLRVEDAGGVVLEKPLNVVVHNGTNLRVTTMSYIERSAGSGMAMRLTTTAPTATDFTWSVTPGSSLPPGLTFATGLNTSIPNATWLAGRVQTPGTYPFSVRATETANPSNVADRQLTMVITPLQFVDPAWELFFVIDVPPARVGEAYAFTFKVAGGTPPYTFTNSPFHPLPAGLSLGSTGVLSGTPAPGAIGNFIVAPIVTDAAGRSMNGEWLTLTVAPAGAAQPLLRPGGNPFQASAGVPYAFALDPLLRGGTAPFTWALAPGHALPPGLSIVAGANGVSAQIAGTASAASATPYFFSLIATDSSSPPQVLTIATGMRVSPLALSPDALPMGVVGTPYSQALTPSGGVAPYTVQLGASSGLPPGLTFAAGAISGTPVSAGALEVQVLITDSAGNKLSKNYRIVVDNALGEAPAVTLSPRPIQVYWEQGSPDPTPIVVGVTSTSGAVPFDLLLAGVPGASLSATSGTTPAAVTVSFDVSGVPVGTYTGLIATNPPGAANLRDWTPVTLTVAPAPPCTYAVNPTSGSMATAGGAGSFSVAAGYTCGWTATPSAGWINVTAGGSGTGNGSVSFTAAPNPDPGARTGTIDVNGAVYMLTQWGTDALSCSFVISPQGVGATAAGGSATVTITASNALCPWTASSAAGLGVAPPSGTGSGSVTVTVPPTASPASQVLTATIAGQTFTVHQSGIDCTVALSPYAASVAAAGTTGSVEVTTPAGCGYSTVTGPSWITVTSGASGTGPGTLVYSVDANSTTFARSGALTIGGQTFTVDQGALACSVTVDTSGLGSPYGTGPSNGAIGITANGPNCAWTASSGIAWASVSPASGTGNGTVNVVVSSNASTVGRSGSLTVAGQSIGITQSGVACSYALDATTGAAPASGGTGSVRVLAPSACGWSAASHDGWLSVVSSGTAGTSEVRFAATANPSASPRGGSLTIAGETYTVTQAGAPCSYTLTGPATSDLLAAEGVSGQTFAFTAAFPGCTPAAVSYAGWITVDATAFAGTSGTVTFSIAANPYGAGRTGTILVGGAVYTVRQTGAPCAFSLNAYGRVFQAAGGSDAVLGTPTAGGCTPDVGTDQPAFILLEPLTGPALDIFTLPYAVAPFPVSLTTGVRFGRITFGGQVVLIKQFSW